MQKAEEWRICSRYRNENRRKKRRRKKDWRGRSCLTTSSSSRIFFRLYSHQEPVLFQNFTESCKKTKKDLSSSVVKTLIGDNYYSRCIILIINVGIYLKKKKKKKLEEERTKERNKCVTVITEICRFWSVTHGNS